MGVEQAPTAKGKQAAKGLKQAAARISARPKPRPVMR